MRQLVFLLIILIASAAAADVCRPGVAGSFYPEDKGELSYQVARLLSSVPVRETRGDVVALIVPHAGYPFSGRTAAYAYEQLAGQRFDTVILLGASHKLSFAEIAVPAYDSLETPLGQVPVDREFIAKLTRLSDKIKVSNEPFNKQDNSLEVQLPFLQTSLKNDFKIVPIFFGNISLANCQALALSLSLLVDDRTLIIASSDLSHYYTYDLAEKMDRQGIALVLNNDLAGYIKALSEGETEACGAPAVITAMLMAPALGANKVELLNYANSGDVTGDRSKVVGYASILFSHQETKLSADEKKKLLVIARRTLRNLVSKKKLPEFNVTEEALCEKRGVFVTLNEGGKLRGCIGYIQPIKPLYLAVQELAVNAAKNDRRFSPVTKAELKKIKIEISALNRLKRLREVSEINVGSDGLYIIKGDRSGLLLPQVAVEWGWGREEFLKQVCLKAGLPEAAWQEQDALLYRFSAAVFRED
jgi:MEMO1 family protein